MLLADHGGVAAAWPGVEQDVKPDPLTGAKRPFLPIGLDILARPGWEALALFSLGPFYADGRIGLDVLALGRPFEHAAHRVQEIAGGRRRLGAAIESGDDIGFPDRGIRLRAAVLQNVQHDVLALLPRRCRQLSPCAGLAIAVPQPLQRSS